MRYFEKKNNLLNTSIILLLWFCRGCLSFVDPSAKLTPMLKVD